MTTEIEKLKQDSERDEMVRYGITRVPVDYFICGQYRYSNLKDAIAQAKRNEFAKGAGLRE
jgi:hypothetical protein